MVSGRVGLRKDRPPRGREHGAPENLPTTRRSRGPSRPRGAPSFVERLFDETASGLDHLAFAVPGHDELVGWARQLEELGVHFSPIAASLSIPGAEVIVLRDPDNIQLELFASPPR